MAKSHDELMNELLMDVPENIGKALIEVAGCYPNAPHHEHWVMDQVLRHVLGDELYQRFVEAYEAPRGESPDRWMDNWDKGVAP